MSAVAFTGQVDLIERAEGFIFILGWLRVDSALLQAGPPRLVLRDANGASESWPLLGLHPRRDPGGQPVLPNALSFQILRPSTLTSERVTASLILGERQVELDPGEVRVQAFRRRGGLDQPDRHAVQGWVLDLPGRNPTLMIDGRIAVTVPIDRPRPDLPFDTGEAEPCFGFRLSLSRLGDLLRACEPGFTLLDGEPHGITLLAGGSELGHRMLREKRRFSGRIERITEGQAIGWATEAEPVEPKPYVEVLLDGTRWHTVPAATPRADLTANGVGSRLIGGAFRIELPTRSLTGVGKATVELRPSHAQEPLGDTRALEGLIPWRPDRGAVLDLLPASDPRQISIVVPIHNAADDVARCVESVLRHTTGRARLLLIDDASTDAAIAELFREWEGLAGVELHRQASNLGFTATCNRGFALAGQDDVVLLNSDTQVGPGWLDGLRLAAHASPRVGTVTAVSNNAGAFSVPELDVDNRLPAWFSTEDMARLARQSALSLWPLAPTGNGFCLYVRRACLEAVGGFDEAAFPRGYGEENDFCMRATAAGFEHRVDDRTWVQHRRSASFGSAKSAHMAASRVVLTGRYPEYRTLTNVFREDAAFLAMRWRLRQALERVLGVGGRPRPRALFVISTESGGTPHTNRDLMEALADRYEPWVLRCDSRAIELTRHGADTPEEVYQLERCISPAAHSSAEYDRCVAGLLIRHGFELVHIRHIAWHGTGLPHVCKMLGIPVVFSFHDFYTLCPTIKLLDAEGRYCGGRCTKGEADCVAELWPAASVPPLRGRFVHRWRATMAAALEHCDAFVTTSAGTRQTLIDGLPFLAERDIRVIPHGRSFRRLSSLAAEQMADEPLRVLVPGNISAAKGAAIVAALAEHDTEREIEFHVLGAVDSILDHPRPGVVLHGRYDRESFAERVAGIGPHLALILSTWPETYCHTLTECWSVGLPVLGSHIGAIAERMGADGGGWLIDPAMEPAGILALLLHLKENSAALRARRDEVLRWQRQTGRHYDTAAMAAEYDLLYREVLERRRSFAEARPAKAPLVVLSLDGERRMDSFRLPLPIHNDTTRTLIFRSVASSYPFGDPRVGRADIVLVGGGASRSRDMVSVAERCQKAGLPLLVETEADPGSAETRSAQASAGASFLVSTPLAARAMHRAGYPASVLQPLLEPAHWLPPVGAAPAVPPSRASCRLLGFADDPGTEILRPVLEELRLLDVADYVLAGPGGLSLGRDPMAALRAIGRHCDMALFPLALAEDEPRILALAASGLVVLRNRIAGEALGETENGQWILPPDPDAWLHAIAELSASPSRLAQMARRARLSLEARLVPGDQASSLDRVLRSAVDALRSA